MAEMFKDRIDAGWQLANKIKEQYPVSHDIKNGIILALPRGGVVVGAEVAKVLNMPLDIIVTRKIGVPGNPEYAVAAVSEHELIVSSRENPDKKYLEEETKNERQEIARRVREYRGDRPEIDLKNKTAIIVDDGLATGLTMEVALREVRQKNPRRIILAVPVAPPETIERLKPLADRTVVLNIEPMFFAVGQFYTDFSQISDLEVKNLLKDY